MNPAEVLLGHFDQIARCKPIFRSASMAGDSTAINLAIYHEFPSADSFTAFTVGLSHFHPPGGSHIELTISMRDSDDIWALAMGNVAARLSEKCAFACGDTIDFKEPISRLSAMSAFVVTHPMRVPKAQRIIDIGIRKVWLMELVPIFQEERAWLRADGTLQQMLGDKPQDILMNPIRPILVQPHS